MQDVNELKTQIQATGASRLDMFAFNFAALARILSNDEQVLLFITIKRSAQMMKFVPTSARLILLDMTGNVREQWPYDEIAQVSSQTNVVSFVAGARRVDMDILIHNNTDVAANLLAERATGVSNGEIAPEPSPEPIRCPKCGSTQITADKKGFGLGKAAVGGVLLGPVGLLGGFMGSGKVEVTCLNCGKKWKPGS